MESNRQIYMEKVNIDEDQLIEMMNAETYLTPQQAVEMGFVDEIAEDKGEDDNSTVLEQMQKQISQLRRTMAAQKAFKAEMQQFYKGALQKDDEDNEDDEDETDTDGSDGEGDEDETDDDEKKNDPVNKTNKLAGLLAKAAAQNLKKER